MSVPSLNLINQFSVCIQLVFDGLFGSVTSPKLRTLTLEFVHHICRKCVQHKTHYVLLVASFECDCVHTVHDVHVVHAAIVL